jgi:PilZ domain
LRRKNAARRSTRLSLQIPVVVTSLDPTCDFRKECKTVFVSAHGCAVVVQERLKDDTPVTMKLVSDGASKTGRVVLAVPLLESVSWLLGVEFDSPGNFWEVEDPPADWRV